MTLYKLIDIFLYVRLSNFKKKLLIFETRRIILLAYLSTTSLLLKNNFGAKKPTIYKEFELYTLQRWSIT